MLKSVIKLRCSYCKSVSRLSTTTQKLLKNEEIKFPKLRVVYKNESGESKWEIMSRLDALKFAKTMNSDIILVSTSSDPPVCRLDNYVKYEMERKTKEKEAAVAQKARSTKEMYFTGVIGPNDLKVKMDRVLKFLADKHSVKVTVTMSAKGHRANPLALNETVMKILNYAEGHVSLIEQGRESGLYRKDFLFRPKSG